jgi:hypothetical protein
MTCEPALVCHRKRGRVKARRTVVFTARGQVLDRGRRRAGRLESGSQISAHWRN